MSHKNNAELRTLTAEELDQQIVDLRKEQFVLRLKKVDGTLDNRLHRIREVRRQIARVKTIQTEKVRAQS